MDTYLHTRGGSAELRCNDPLLKSPASDLIFACTGISVGEGDLLQLPTLKRDSTQKMIMRYIDG